MSMFPLKYEVIANASEGISNKWESSVKGLPKIEVAVPPEFNGPGKAYSPEDLYGLAVLNCLIAVYKDICEKNQIKFKEINGKIIVTLDKSHEGNGLVITHLDITFDISGASDKDKARIFLEKALKTCPVTNSIKSGKTCHITIT
ncbi:MAG: OsmC family protein [Parachlamydiales bacterium]|nr:OsmC family protein [Parachlamydiales bacterium]